MALKKEKLRCCAAIAAPTAFRRAVDFLSDMTHVG